MTISTFINRLARYLRRLPSFRVTERKEHRVIKCHCLPVELVEKIFHNLADIIDQETHTFPAIEWAFGRSALCKLQGNPPGPRVLTTQQPMLRLLACVCRSWYLTATEHLYRHIYISSYSALGLLAEALSNRTNIHLPPLVRTFMMANDILDRPFVGYTKRDMENLQKIYKVCRNLHAVKLVGPPNSQEMEGSLPLLSIGYSMNWSDITRLEMHFPHSTSDSGDITLLGSVDELPSLQELLLYANASTSSDNVADKRRVRIMLPLMPQLRRLSICKWHTNKQTLNVPPCPLLYAWELIDCTIYPSDLFKLLPPMYYQGSQSLESLIITGLVISDSSEFHLALFEYPKLSYLCVPMKLFTYDDYCRPPSLSPYLRHLIVTDVDGRANESVVKVAEDYLVEVLQCAAKITPCHLKRVQIITSSTFEWSKAKDCGKAANPEIKIEVLTSAAKIRPQCLLKRDQSIASFKFKFPFNRNNSKNVLKATNQEMKYEISTFDHASGQCKVLRSQHLYF